MDAGPCCSHSRCITFTVPLHSKQHTCRSKICPLSNGDSSWTNNSRDCPCLMLAVTAVKTRGADREAVMDVLLGSCQRLCVHRAMHFDGDSDGPKNAHRMPVSMVDAARCMLDVISCRADDAGRRRRRPLRWRPVAMMATGRHRRMLAACHPSGMAMSASRVQPPRLSFDTGLSTEPPRAALLASTKTLPNHTTTTCCEKPSRCAASSQNVGGVCLSDVYAKHSRPDIEWTTQC